jgi:hypothetical protein
VKAPQLVEISLLVTGFTVLCEACVERGWERASFAGQLDVDLEEGLFLCRRGHGVRVVRTEPAARDLPATEAA